MELQEKRDFFDILKGIAIFSIVMGHIEGQVIQIMTSFHNVFMAYVYSYHLAVFFFVSGFLYNKEKYQDAPSLNFVNRFKRCWKPFFLYCILIEIAFFLIPSFFHVVSARKGAYDISLFLTHVTQFFILRNPPDISTSLWFVGPLIISSSIFGIIIYISRKIEKLILTSKPTAIKATSVSTNSFIIFSSILISLIGYNEISNKIQFMYNAQTGLFVVPLLMLGFYANSLIKNLKKFLNPFFAICAFAITLYLLNCYFPNHNIHAKIDLRFGRYLYWQYYVLAVLGVYQIMYLAKIILFSRYLKILKNFFSFIGKYTFEIMTFHRVVFFVLNATFTFFIATKIENEIAKYFFFFLFVILACFIPSVTKKIILWLIKKSKSYIEG